jgi:hypothetical protein
MSFSITIPAGPCEDFKAAGHELVDIHHFHGTEDQASVQRTLAHGLVDQAEAVVRDLLPGASNTLYGAHLHGHLNADGAPSGAQGGMTVFATAPNPPQQEPTTS